jgi:hypothetical protein
MDNDQREHPVTRVLAGVFGLLSLPLGLLMLFYEPRFWQMWLPSLVIGPVFLIVAVKGRAPNLLRPWQPEQAVARPTVRARHVRVTPAAWWQRLLAGFGVGVFFSGLHLLVDALFFGSMFGFGYVVESLLTLALPFGFLVAVLFWCAPLIGNSHARLLIAGIVAGAIAGAVSWRLGLRDDGVSALWPVAIGAILGGIVARSELRNAVAQTPRAGKS